MTRRADRRHLRDNRPPEFALERADRDELAREVTMGGRPQGDRAGFSRKSPRWRDPDAPAQHLVELERRFRNAQAPSQRGAIDDYPTIAPQVRSGPPGLTAWPT